MLYNLNSGLERERVTLLQREREGYTVSKNKGYYVSQKVIEKFIVLQRDKALNASQRERERARERGTLTNGTIGLN